MKKPSCRKCVGCQEKKEKSKLIRIMKLNNSNEIVIFPTSTHFGRSAYLCHNKDCLEIAVKKRKLQRALKCEVPPGIIEHLKNILDS